MATAINFRATSGYVTDNAAETYCLGEAYPVTRGGLTFGFASSMTSFARDRNAALDRRLAGVVFKSNSAGATTDFKLDLPSGAGTYDVRLALGDATSAQGVKAVIKDGVGGTVLATITGFPQTAEFTDASGVIRTAANWPGANVLASLTFATSQMCISLGGPSGAPYDGSATTIAHLSVVAASADTTAPTLTSPTGTQTGSTTASGTVTTDEANGTLYFLASTNATETAATVKAASSQAVSATGSQAVSFTGLTASTTYYAHYCHRDAAGNDSTVANSASFTTAAGGGSGPAPRVFTPRPGMGVNIFGAR